MRVPETRREEVRESLHGVSLTDPYRWLEDPTDAEVGSWLKEQDDYARSRLSSLPGRTAVEARLGELVRRDLCGPPRRRGQRYFYYRRRKDWEQMAFCLREGRDGEERVLLDPAQWGEPGAFSLGVARPSPDGGLVAYARNPNASDEATLYIRDVDTGEDSTIDVIPGARYAVPSWLPDGTGFYYTWVDTSSAVSDRDRPGTAEIRFHRLGTSPDDDSLIWERTDDPRTFLNAEVTQDGRWLLVSRNFGWDRSDVWVLDRHAPDAEPLPLALGFDALVEARGWDDRFFMLTTSGAPHGHILGSDASQPDRHRILVPEAPDAILESFEVVGGRLALVYIAQSCHRMEIRELDGTFVRTEPIPTGSTVVGPIGQEDEDEAVVGWTTFTTPIAYDLVSMNSGARERWHAPDLGIDPERFETLFEEFPSADGTPIPLFVVKRRDLPDGPHPTLLTGYGGFRVSRTPSFNPETMTLMERGFVYALPSLRGGAEQGAAWHDAGRLKNKQTTFDDFIGAAEHLISRGITTPDRLAIMGGSNGGLLVGAAMTQRPELFGAVVCAVPLLDMLRYHLFGSGQTWISEYGSADDPEMFPILHRYSPYHRIASGVAYPPLLLLSADHDDRVDPMHARKFAAAMQHDSSGGPVLLRVQSQAGHGGSDRAEDQIGIQAETIGFLEAHVGAGRS